MGFYILPALINKTIKQDYKTRDTVGRRCLEESKLREIFKIDAIANSYGKSAHRQWLNIAREPKPGGPTYAHATKAMYFDCQRD